MRHDTIVAASLGIFKQYDTALTLRQLFYRLVAKRVIDNTMSNYKGLSRIMVRARETGEILGHYIEDRTRRTFNSDVGFDSIDDFKESCEKWARDLAGQFNMPLWKGQPRRVEVWVEKDALARICSEAAKEFNVVTCPSRGYSSFTYVAKAARRMRYYKEDPEVVVLCFGDYDPSGLDIARDLEARLNRYGAPNLTVKWIALTLDQIEAYSLPPMPAKSSDPRLTRFIADTGGSEAVELDALEPNVLTDLITEAIQAELDKDVWQERQAEISEQTEKVKEMFEKVRLVYNEENEEDEDDA